MEDNQFRNDWFLSKLPDAVVADNPTAAVSILKTIEYDFDIVFLDHDCAGKFFVSPEDPEYLNKTFWKVAQELHRTEYAGQVVIHSGNPVGAKRMQDLFGSSIASHVIPFGQFDIEVF